MPSKGGNSHKYLKMKSIQRAVEQFDIDMIKQIIIEPQGDSWEHAFKFTVQLSGLRVERNFFPDVVFAIPISKPQEFEDIYGKRELVDRVICVECEVRPNSQLLVNGVRKLGYKLLKETHGKVFTLILAKYKGGPVSEPEMFDEIWEFDKPKNTESDGVVG